MTTPDFVLAIKPLVETFEHLGIGYYVGGSMASSAYGLPRATLDVDLIAALEPRHVDPLVAALEGSYYIDADMIHAAIQRRTSFNIIHLDTMLKLDIFVLKAQAYDQSAFQRASAGHLPPRQGGFPVVLSSAEDIVLHKLHWFRLGGEVSERQWHDVLGVLKVQGQSLDLQYMKKWAQDLRVADLLRHALQDAELE